MWDFIVAFYEGGIFFYCLALFSLYGFLTILSACHIRKNLNVQKYRKQSVLVESPLTPHISIIAPAYNESATIIPNIRSLLTLNYPQFEVIVVNDGSTDDTLEKLIAEFDLVETNFVYNQKLQTHPVKRFFKSTNKAYAKLLVIDKVNGKAKADAVNAGINAASFPYMLNTDVDCILDSNTLLKMIQPFMDSEKRVIAVGAPLRIANSCEVDSGMMERVRPPKRLLPRFQELEYIRSFVMGKVGWSYINAVPNISGALGLFDKEIVIQTGGYDPKSVAEDMELIMRMGKYMCDNRQDYAMQYIPQTLCWTEGPQTLKVFTQQRARWGRGLMQVFSYYWKMLLNPKYKKMGLIIFPYNFFFELLAPLVELFGIMYFIYTIATGTINWTHAIVLLFFVWFFSIMISAFSVLWDQLVTRYYKTWKEVLGVCIMAFFEPFIYHPLVLFSTIKGYLSHWLGKKPIWGNMERNGFASQVSDN